jgi:putative endonuclease
MTENAVPNRRKLGKQAEQFAAEHLEASGYRVIARNWRCPRGELDLICEKDGCIIFVEVRSRRLTGTYGTPEESVNARKQRQVRDTARYYLYAAGLLDRCSRFDAFTVVFDRAGAVRTWNHLPDAF